MSERAGGGPPTAAWFLGPRAENSEVWRELLDHVFDEYIHWRRNYFPTDPIVVGRARRRAPEHEAWLDDLTARLDTILNELKHHFPFHSPRYIGHMLSEQSLPSFLGYVAGLLFNPNNVTDEAAPVTVALELEVGRTVAAMLGYNPRRAWAHLTSGGTVANIEALWVARTVQFAPLAVRDACGALGLDLEVRLANGRRTSILGVGHCELLGVRPADAAVLLRRLVHAARLDWGCPAADAAERIDAEVAAGPWNVARRGLHAVVGRLAMRPVLFAPASAHYSIAKAANVLGYGEDSVRIVPVNRRFQMDMSALESALLGLEADEYVAGVVAVAGTTEEGAVDPIHHIRFLRDRLEIERSRSFWLHVDAAWGGYIRSLFCGVEVPHLPHGAPLAAISDAYVRALNVEERFQIDEGVDHREERTMVVRWADHETYAAFLAMGDADSITIDPHKQGYVPYPAGLVAFRNGLAAELVSQRAPYIADDEGPTPDADRPVEIHAVGPHILEGSKPGAAALACWLAHTTVPLVWNGHGEIIRGTLLRARRLFKYLVNHRRMFRRLHQEAFGTTDCRQPFTFVPLFEPETNILLYVARPMAWNEGRLEPAHATLSEMNRLNQRIYAGASITPRQAHRRLSTSQPFFISRTRIGARQYAADSLAPLLASLGVGHDEYAAEGLFALRSTVMNPWYAEAERAGLDYLRELLLFLHQLAAGAMDEIRGAATPALEEEER